jgi:hypothetical protein
MAEEIKVVKPKKKIGGLIQKGLEKAGKTINSANKIVSATKTGIEREETIIKETTTTSALLVETQVEYQLVVKYWESRNLSDTELENVLQTVDDIYAAKTKIYTDKLEALAKEQEQLTTSYKELIKKEHEELTKRNLKQKQAQKAARKKKRKFPPIKDIISILCYLANILMEFISIGNKRIEELVDETNSIIENANTASDIEKAKLFRDNTLTVIASSRKQLEDFQKVVEILQILAPLITPIVFFLKANPVPAAVPPGVGVPLGVINTLDAQRQKLQDIIDSSLIIIYTLNNLASKLLDDLNYQEERINQINNILDQSLEGLSPLEIKALIESTSSGLGYLSGYDYKDFKFYIKEEENPQPKNVVKGNKRRYATANNKDGNVLIQSKYSFTLDPDVLVEELKLRIDKENLVA